MDIGHNWTSIYRSQSFQYTYCDLLEFDFCKYDLAGNLLNHLLTNLETRPIQRLKAGDSDWKQNGVLKKFDQREFVKEPFPL